MPLEIRELIIKARIDSEPGPSQTPDAEALRKLKEAILEETMERLEELIAERAHR